MKNNWKILIEAVVAGLLVFLLTVFNLLSPLDYMVRDKLYQMPRGINSNIKIVGIDERTLDAYGPIQTWSRGRYAELIKKLNENSDAKPALIGFDILFSGYVDEEGDAALAAACEESGNVIIVNNLIYDDRMVRDSGGELIKRVKSVAEPYEEISNVTNVGYSNVAQDSDGVVRYMSDGDLLFTKYPDPKYMKQCQSMLKTHFNKMHNFWMPSGGAKCRERFQWAYINYIRTKDYIFMPALSKNADCIEDTTVRRQFELRFPEYPRENIIPIYALEALKQEGGLHCCSWNILK